MDRFGDALDRWINLWLTCMFAVLLPLVTLITLGILVALVGSFVVQVLLPNV